MKDLDYRYINGLPAHMFMRSVWGSNVVGYIACGDSNGSTGIYVLVVGFKQYSKLGVVPFFVI